MGFNSAFKGSRRTVNQSSRLTVIFTFPQLYIRHGLLSDKYSNGIKATETLPLRWLSHRNGYRQPKTYVKPEAAITVFVLLMMSGVSLETC
jgi:hypothetical protein